MVSVILGIGMREAVLTGEEIFNPAFFSPSLLIPVLISQTVDMNREMEEESLFFNFSS